VHTAIVVGGGFSLLLSCLLLGHAFGGGMPGAVAGVTRGENAGHELHEFTIVRSIHKLGSWQGAGESFSVPLTALTSDATAVAVLVQQRDQGPIVGAASRALR